MGPKVIVITGVSGSGKTTQSKLLLQHLKETDRKVGYVHQFTPTFRFTRWIKDKTLVPIKSLQARIANPETVNMKTDSLDHSLAGLEYIDRGFGKRLMQGLLAMYLIGMGWVRTWMKFLLNLHQDILVFDRYFHDELIRVEWKLSVSLQKFIWLIKLVPAPTTLIFLDITAETAWERMKTKEISREAHAKQQKLYRTWMEALPLDNQLNWLEIEGKSLESVDRCIALAIEKDLPGATHKGG